MKNLGAILLGSHCLILRIRMEGGRSALREVHRGTQAQCEAERWHTDLTPMRGPGVIKTELHVITVEEWRAVCAKQIRQPLHQ